jgi:hypothetical protein
MLQLKLTLYDDIELAGFHAYYQAVLQRRANLAAAQVVQPDAPGKTVPDHIEPTEPEVVAPPEAGVVDPPAEDTGVEAETVDDVPPPSDGPPEGVNPFPATPEMAVVTAPEPTTLQAIFIQYYKAHGFAAARKKLDTFAVQRVTDLKPEQLPEFLASLRGPA